jgi:hypothetical protein
VSVGSRVCKADAQKRAIRETPLLAADIAGGRDGNSQARPTTRSRLGPDDFLVERIIGHKRAIKKKQNKKKRRKNYKKKNRFAKEEHAYLIRLAVLFCPFFRAIA